MVSHSAFSPPPPPTDTGLSWTARGSHWAGCLDGRRKAAAGGEPLRWTWAGVSGWSAPAVCPASAWSSRSCVQRGWPPGRCCGSRQWTWTHACPCTGPAGHCCSRSAITGMWYWTDWHTNTQNSIETLKELAQIWHYSFECNYSFLMWNVMCSSFGDDHHMICSITTSEVILQNWSLDLDMYTQHYSLELTYIAELENWSSHLCSSTVGECNWKTLYEISIFVFCFSTILSFSLSLYLNHVHSTQWDACTDIPVNVMTACVHTLIVMPTFF